MERGEDPRVLLEPRRFSFGWSNFWVNKVPEDTTTVRDSRLPFLQFVLALITSVIGVTGFTLILWNSYEQWGSLPSLSGGGLGLYGGIGLGIVLLVFLTVYYFVLWRRSTAA